MNSSQNDSSKQFAGASNSLLHDTKCLLKDIGLHETLNDRIACLLSFHVSLVAEQNRLDNRMFHSIVATRWPTEVH